MGEKKVSRLLIPSLALSRTAPQARGLLSNFLLVEIAQTYSLSLGATNQIKTITSFVGIFAAILMGFLSVKYRQKMLLVTGLGIVSLSMFGCYLAPSFISLVFFYAIGGIGANMIMPMATALTGTHIPRSDRSKALGWLFAVPATMYFVGIPIVNYLGSWRNSFLLFALPLTLITLILCLRAVPQSKVSSTDKEILAGYKGVFKSNSAVGSLIGSMLGGGVWMVFLSLGPSLYRQVYELSRSQVGSVSILMSLSYIVGAIVSRNIVPKLGTRQSTIISTLLLGLSFFIFGLKYPLLIAIGLGFLLCFIAGLRISSAQGLCLGQLPELRGPMMSMNSAFGSLGSVITLALSGYLLNTFGWFTMFPVIGVFGLIGGVTVLLFVSQESSV